MTKTRDGWLVLAGGVIGVPELTAGDLAAPGKSLLFGELRDEYCHLELSETWFSLPTAVPPYNLGRL